MERRFSVAHPTLNAEPMLTFSQVMKMIRCVMNGTLVVAWMGPKLCLLFSGLATHLAYPLAFICKSLFSFSCLQKTRKIDIDISTCKQSNLHLFRL